MGNNFKYCMCTKPTTRMDGEVWTLFMIWGACRHDRRSELVTIHIHIYCNIETNKNKEMTRNQQVHCVFMILFLKINKYINKNKTNGIHDHDGLSQEAANIRANPKRQKRGKMAKEIRSHRYVKTNQRTASLLKKTTPKEEEDPNVRLAFIIHVIYTLIPFVAIQNNNSRSNYDEIM